MRKPREGFIYQKFIHNETEDDQVVDLRVPIVKRTLDFAYVKYCPHAIRFTNDTAKTALKAIDTLFSKEEIEKINRYVAPIHLDYGELDILRDRDDHNIYIVDVNNTPQGPPKHLPAKDGRRVISPIAKAFEEAFIKQ
ncbi:MAG: hypothetical protein CSA95_08715 [Bacteroidetes bacterium]|nr:MAG: hypothetical protein CSA95_08715 [Bacteroidota bacterium]